MRNLRSSKCKALTNIDMTPLMDLTFMLLIVFVITVPVMEYATDVTPPELNGQTSLEKMPNPIVIVINKEGFFSIDAVPVAQDTLTAELSNRRLNRGLVDVLIRADGTRPYEDVVGIMRAAQRAGFQSVSLMTQAEKLQ